MSDWIERLDRARAHVRPNMGPQRMQAIRDRVQRELSQKPRRRAIALAGVVAVLLLIGGVAAQRLGFSPSGPQLVQGPAFGKPGRAPLVLDDGSTVEALGDESRVERLESGSVKQAVRLAAGKARFEVTPRPTRKFEVHARDVTVTVLGTAFVVAIEASGVSVVVERGHVRVRWPGGTRELRGGEQAVFDAVKPPPSAPEAPPLPTAEPSSARPPVQQSWQALAHGGEFAKAYARMNAEGPSAVRNDPDDLWLAADVARLGGRPDRSVAYLESLIRGHGRDSRTPLAAYTLGNVLLGQLGRPRQAAAAYAKARWLAPGGELAQDALAREVESWSRAGDPALARARADEYLQHFPKGRHRKTVRRFGGIE